MSHWEFKPNWWGDIKYIRHYGSHRVCISFNPLLSSLYIIRTLDSDATTGYGHIFYSFNIDKKQFHELAKIIDDLYDKGKELVIDKNYLYGCVEPLDILLEGGSIL